MLSLVPQAYASSVDPSVFGNVISPILNNIVNPLVELAFAVAVVVFAFGVLRLIWSGDVSESSRKTAKLTVVGGLIGMFIMLSAWGIIQLVANTVGQFGK